VNAVTWLARLDKSLAGRAEIQRADGPPERYRRWFGGQ
jgi:hypothetical protein